MKYLLYAILMFCLPHANWLPLKLGLAPEQIPFGLVNLIMSSALVLWFVGKLAGQTVPNQVRIYTIFIGMVAFSLAFALMNSYEDFDTTIRLAKMELMLLLLYYVPLTSLKDQGQFKVVFLLFLAIHLIIGFEVMKSGVLAGSSFHDGKRGSGPFSEGLTGSDIAGGYLAQTTMFFCAFAMYRGSSFRTRALATGCVLVMTFGIFATYARGALVACVAGVAAMLPFLGLKPKLILAAGSLVLFAALLAPESVITRVDNTTQDSGSYDASTMGRFRYWETAWGIIKEQPLGIGVGQVRGAFQERIDKHVDPHNAFLFTACEYGVLGLVVFCLLVVTLYRKSLVVWREPGNPELYRIYALGMGGMLGSFVATNFFYANFYKDLIMGSVALHFGLLAFVLADINRSKGEHIT